MKLPKSAPKSAQTEIIAALQAMERPDVRDVINRANAEYFHWDEFKYRPHPKDFKAEQLWLLVKFSRHAGRRWLPLTEVGGQRSFSYWLPPSTMELLHTVDRWGGSRTLAMDGSASIEAMRDQVIVSSLMEEAIATAQIEGAATTRRVAKAMLREKRRPRDRSERMILNSYNTMQLLRKKSGQELTLDFLFEIQTSITQDTLDDPSAAGRLRVAADDVAIVDLRDDEVVFTPPPAGDLDDRLKTFIDFANQPSTPEQFIHPLVKAAALHFWLAYEHPFVDGNGRTARAIFYWFMLKNGYWMFEFLTISRVIHKHPGRYYKSFLFSERDEEDMTYSILFLLDATREAMLALREYLHVKQAEQREVSRTLRALPDLNHRQRSTLDHLLKHPGELVTFQSHARTHDVTYVTARGDLLDLERRQLLQEAGSGRKRVFVPTTNLAEILSAPADRTR